MNLEMIETKAVAGVEKKTPLLFVHGSFCSAPIWQQRFMPYFSEQGHDCYAFSFRGHGKSGGEWPLDFYGLADYTEDISEAINAINESPVLIGHSLGGMVVQKYIEDHTCAGTILLNSLPPSGALSSLAHTMDSSPELYWGLMQAMMFGTDIVQIDQLKKLVSEETHPSHLEEALQLFQPESMRVLNDVAYFDIPRRQSQSGFPIVVIGGDADVMIPTAALEETALFHDADLEIIPGAPHVVMLDHRWERVAECMHSWMVRSI